MAWRLYGGADIDSFLALLDTVRSPRVGDRVDLELPQYLVSAMPNLSETALIEAAHPLDDLDEHRRKVLDLGMTESALSAMVGVYRQYALSELNNELRAARELSASFKRTREQARKAKEVSAEASVAEAQSRDHQELLEARDEELQQEIHALRGRLPTLRGSSWKIFVDMCKALNGVPLMINGSMLTRRNDNLRLLPPCRAARGSAMNASIACPKS